jgi:hypothetical protein
MYETDYLSDELSDDVQMFPYTEMSLKYTLLMRIRVYPQTI